MSNILDGLFGFEREALLEALRRDLRAEQEKFERGGMYRDYHFSNVRMTTRLLEVLNPRVRREGAAGSGEAEQDRDERPARARLPAAALR